MKKIQKISLLILLIFIFVSTNKVNIYASYKFANLGQIHKQTSSVEKGGYTFTLSYNKIASNYNLNIYKKNSKTPMVSLSNIASNVLVNGRTLYYSYKNTQNQTVDLIYMNVPTKKTKVYGTFSNAQNLFFDGIAGNSVYFSVIHPPAQKKNASATLYSLNPFNGKINVILTNTQLNKLGSKRIFYASSNDPINAYTLFSSDYTGKNSIQISQNVVYHETIGGKIYYVNFENPLSGCYLYSANEDGSNKTKISKKFKCQNVISITPTHITYILSNYTKDKVSYHKMEIYSGKTEQIPPPTD